MAIKYNNSKIRVWQGVSKKLGTHNIGIRFQNGFDKTEIERIHVEINLMLEREYGKGIE